MVIITYKCDKCGKEQTGRLQNVMPIGYAGINGYRFDICQECLNSLGLITEEMLEKKTTEEILRSIMDKTAGQPFK